MRWVLLGACWLLAASSDTPQPPPSGSSPAIFAGHGEERMRICYVVSTWWPKIDGAAISAMGHVRYMALNIGHPTLVVRPAVPDVIHVAAAAAGDKVDPLPPTELLQYVEYGTIPSARGGGYELVVDPLLFYDAEAAIALFRPDVLLVMDPEFFMFDAFRLPGFNSLLLAPNVTALAKSGPLKAPVTIGCFTTFYVDGIYKLPDFWWMPRFARATLDMGIATAYGHFDHVFVNCETTASYLRPLVVQEREGGGEITLRERVRIVGSRGVSSEFCDNPPAAECAANVKAASRLRSRPAGTIALVYVGRLAFDKSVDEMLAAHVKAMQRLNWPLATLYVIGAGELEGAVREVERKHPNHVAYLGTISHQHVSCVLREADVYVTAAPNETYGRAMVEGMRCSLPVVGLNSCNLHVQHEHNGLLAKDTHDLADQIVRALTEPQLRARLAENAKTVGGVIAGAIDDPNWMMLEAVLHAYYETRQRRSVLGQQHGQPHMMMRERPWHWFWSVAFGISLWLDDPPDTMTLAALALAALVVLMLVVRACWRLCCYRRRVHEPSRQPFGEALRPKAE